MVDFNSYFASVEQEVRPELRGRPVAVVPVLADTTCCIAASYEAKGFGVRTGTQVGAAKRMCPGLEIVEARPSIYVDYHHQLVAAVDACTHVEEVMSIDEMACELTGKLRERERAVELAHRIKRTIAERVGKHLKSSIGIAPNRFLAKTASDMQKPDGLTVLELADLPQALFRLELRDLCGIGAKMELRLRGAGLRNVRDLCLADKETLVAAWGGIEGERMYLALRGSTLAENAVRHRTLGHSHVLAPEKRNPADALAVLHRLLQKAATRMRREGYLAGGLQVTAKFVGGGKWREAVHFAETDDTLHFTHTLNQLWAARPDAPRAIMFVGVTLLDLTLPQNATSSLFERSSRRPALNRAVDLLNERFGKNAVYFGGAHTARTAAGMHIAFQHVPNLETDGD